DPLRARADIVVYSGTDGAVTVAQQDRHRICSGNRDRYVQVTIAIEISQNRPDRRRTTDRVTYRSKKTAAPVPEHNTDSAELVDAIVHDKEVRRAISIKVAAGQSISGFVRRAREKLTASGKSAISMA